MCLYHGLIFVAVLYMEKASGLASSREKKEERWETDKNMRERQKKVSPREFEQKSSGVKPYISILGKITLTTPPTHRSSIVTTWPCRRPCGALGDLLLIILYMCRISHDEPYT